MLATSIGKSTSRGGVDDQIQLQTAPAGQEKAYKSLYQRSLKDGEIRLLALSTGMYQKDAILACHLAYSVLHDSNPNIPKVDYCALSYAWGTSADEQLIHCNGHEVRIRKNLHEALTQIWTDSPTVLLWCDALCINQIDVVEKNNQVAALNVIFSSAREVIVWLGTEKEYTARLWEALQIQSTKSYEGLPRSDAFGVASRHRYILPDIHETLSLPWFTRAWTVQEVILAKKGILLFGNFKMSWDLFESACIELAMTDSWMSEEASLFSLSSLRRSYSQEGPPPLSRVLMDTQDREATDPRDKIFALLGLLNTTRFAHVLKPDYSTSVAKVYEAATRVCLWEDRHLMILRGAGLVLRDKGHYLYKTEDPKTQRTYEIGRSLPSWVPNWCNARAVQEIASWEYNQSKKLHASTSKIEEDTAPDLEAREERVLTVKGVQLGVLSYVNPAGKSDKLGKHESAARPNQEPLHLMMPACAHHLQDVAEGVGRIDQPGLKAIVTNDTPSPVHSQILPPPGKSTVAIQLLRHVRRSCACIGRDLQPPFPPSYPLPPPPWFEVVLPKATQNSDWLVALYGGFELYVLRPLLHDRENDSDNNDDDQDDTDAKQTGETTNHFLLVGESSGKFITGVSLIDTAEHFSCAEFQQGVDHRHEERDFCIR